MRNSLRILSIAILFAYAACAPCAGAEKPAPGDTGKDAAPAGGQPAEPAAPAAQPAPEPGPEAPQGEAVEPAAPSDSSEAAARQVKLYQDYERLVRVMDIVESRYVQPVESEQLFEGAIEGILGSLDPYSAYIPADAYKEFMEETEQQFSGIGITIAVEKERIMVVTTLEGMPAFRAGVLPGDYILKIDDKTVDELGPLDEVARKLRGLVGSSVVITFFRPSTAREFTLTLTREEIPITTLRGYRSDPTTGKPDFMLDARAGFGYIRISKFAQNTAKEFDDAYLSLSNGGMEGLVIDLRYNPGGLLDSAVAIADRFLDEGLIVRTQGRAGMQSDTYARPGDTYGLAPPIVILVNEYSASASEVLGGALKDHRRAVLVGARSYGKGSVQNIIDLDGQGAIKLTVAYYYTPSGRLVHRLPGAKEWGLEPDVVQAMTADEQAKLRDQWSGTSPGKPAGVLGEDGGPVVDVQLARGLDILRGMILARRQSGRGN